MSGSSTDFADLLTAKETARRLRLTEPTLRNWRTQHKGPAWIKVGGKVLYEAEAVDAYIESCRMQAS